MSQNITDIKNMFSSAVAGGDMSQQAAGIMINALDDTDLAGCMGTTVEELETDDVTVVSLILDKSGSMSPHQATVRIAYDTLVSSLKGSKQAGSMIVSARCFATTSTLLYGFKKVEEVDPIGNNYIADGSSTALHDTMISALTDIKAYSQNLKNQGIRVKSIIVVFSDGEDNEAPRKAKDVKIIAEDLLKGEQYYLVYVGYATDPSVDLKKVAGQIGFGNVLISQATESEIRKTMGLVSKSIIRASQTQVGANSFFS